MTLISVKPNPAIRSRPLNGAAKSEMMIIMTASANPFPLPATLAPALQRVFAYWQGLKRAGNEMPFWDDVDLSALPDLAGRLLLLDVFAAPERFRVNVIGQDLQPRQTDALRHRFIDEAALGGELIFLRAQSSATVEAAAPTFYRCTGTPAQPAFSRLLLPMWGDGRIGMLLGASDPG